MSKIPPPPAHIQEEIEELDRTVTPALKEQGLRLAVGDEYAWGRTVTLYVAGTRYRVRAVSITERQQTLDPELVTVRL